MRFVPRALLIAACCALVGAACSSGSAVTSTGTSSGTGGSGGMIHSPPDAGTDVVVSDASPDADNSDDAGQDADAAAPPTDTLGSNRDRLLGTYYAFLKADPSTTQSNGLSGAGVTSVCDLWNKLDPSSQAVFLTLTARMQGSVLGDDKSSMLWHVLKLYRLTGGQNATATDPGSCGGGEYNRMIMSMDAHLHASQLAANTNKGAVQSNGAPDIADIPAGGVWRDSHDLGGPHAPFDLSDETEQGAPRGQTQYFSDPTSALASMPLGRMDLMTLVDPYALEMDQDYDCAHNSNPSCSYTFYGPFCAPETSALGTDIYSKTYGSIDAGWMPLDCGP